MGMYTELVMNVSLKDDMPSEIADLLRQMINGPFDPMLQPPASVADAPLFKTDRWRFMLNTGSFYFVPEGASKLVEHDHGRIIRHLTIRTDLKNYSGEIEAFVDFIAPFIEETYGEDKFAGYMRYEEADHPTLLYFNEGKVIWRQVA